MKNWSDKRFHRHGIILFQRHFCFISVYKKKSFTGIKSILKKYKFCINLCNIFLKAETRLGCRGALGRRGGKQYLNLKPSDVGSDCFRLGTIQHGILHGTTLRLHDITPTSERYITDKPTNFLFQVLALSRSRLVRKCELNKRCRRERDNFKAHNNSFVTAYAVRSWLRYVEYNALFRIRLLQKWRKDNSRAT